MPSHIPPLGPISEKLKASQLKWTDFTKAIPLEYTAIQEGKAWLVFFRAVIIWFFLIWCAQKLYLVESFRWYHYILSLVISFGIFCCYANLFTLGHDAGHYCFSKIKTANKIVGHFILSLFHIGFHNWKIAHNFHHMYSQTINRDTTWTKDKMTAEEFANSDQKKRQDYHVAYATPIGILVGYYVACFNYFFFTRYYSFIPLEQSQKRQVAFSSFLVLVVSIGHVMLFYSLGGLGFYLNYHLLPLSVGAVAAVGIPLLQHSHEHAVYFDEKSWTPMRGQILGTYNFRMPYFFERVFNDINLHVVHHINPKVPWYNLRKSYHELKGKYPEFILEYDLSWTELKKIYDNPLVEWDPQLELYKSVPAKREVCSSIDDKRHFHVR